MNGRDKFYVAYFVMHLVISVVMDSGAVIPEQYQFGLQRQLNQFHIEQNNDLLMAAPPTWLKSFLWIELVFQVPFFVIGAIGLCKGCKKTYPLILVYCVEAAVTTFGCLAEVSFMDALTTSEKINLAAMYMPMVLIPVVMGIDFYRRILSWIPGKEKTQ
uniref:Efficient mitochondria targeting-associated protein 19 n=1 Tax=Blastobotrys adeninivorans TaxID=409370 RepID=A0A060T2R5_BLAAD